ncbi:MAG: maleylpyruvate isomerase family mycothiol-dependent enzyme [Streptosporangiales bacterium]|nr:maleylpyruvate isomerase family mycothiol-dependent enzyme [Streptosporangiales bacterium]
MVLPLVDELRQERRRLLDTLRSLTDEEFESGPTLCQGWAPRDVLAHVMGVDRPGMYVRCLLRIDTANARMVDHGRRMDREELMAAAVDWAERPSLTTRLAAGFLLGDLGVHHQDILRGLGRSREIPRAVTAAIFREGIIWSWPFGRKLLHHRVVPTTEGGRPIGRGSEVRGPTEALGMWLAGRHSVEPELEFAS